ncbi:hypothetical protein G6K86_29920, partial [Agrobacterium rhizogenes]|nr:hypothetical protein [Rhizobium rhizogenes]
AYWKQHLAGAPVALELPTDRPRPAVQSFRGGTVLSEMAAPLYQQIKELSREMSVTIFVIYAAAIRSVINAITGQRDIIIGFDYGNRYRSEIYDLIGFFGNQLPLRFGFSSVSVKHTLKDMQREILEAQNYGDIPFHNIVTALKARPNLSRHPLFQVKVAYQAISTETEIANLKLSEFPVPRGTSKCDLTWYVNHSNERDNIHLEYDSALFTAGKGQLLMELFKKAILLILKDHDQPYEDLIMKLSKNHGAKDDSGTAMRSKASAEILSKLRNAKLRSARNQDGNKREAVTNIGVLQAPPFQGRGFPSDLITSINFLLPKHGALLVSGAEIDNPDRLKRIAGQIISKFEIEGGEHNRTGLVEGVYTPVPFSPENELLWHNENTFNHKLPSKIIFACGRPAAIGGESTIADSRAIYNTLDKSIVEKFVTKGVMYARVFDRSVGRTWQEIFRTDDRQVVEEKCAHANVRCEWLDSGRLRTIAIRPAIKLHPLTHELAWVAQIQHWHEFFLPTDVRQAMNEIFGDEMPRACYFGDGSKIDDEVASALLSTYREVEAEVPLRFGDLLIMDNILVAHGRRAFSGNRELFVAMGDLVEF